MKYSLLKKELKRTINLFDVPILDEGLRLITPGNNSHATVQELINVIEKGENYVADMQNRMENIRKLISGEIKSREANDA